MTSTAIIYTLKKCDFISIGAKYQNLFAQCLEILPKFSPNQSFCGCTCTPCAPSSTLLLTINGWLK